VKTVPLNKKKHKRNLFDCGVEVLNNPLCMMASQQSDRDNTRTFVLEDIHNPELIIGYYTLTMTSVDLSLLPQRLQKKHRNAQSGGLIARLAVDKNYVKQGFGGWLLIDALKKMLFASNSVAFPLVIVDAKAGAKQFYEKFGFVPFNDMPNKLFITITDMKTSLSVSD